jgi:hypothetical protein
MSTINTFNGAFFLTPDHPVGYGTQLSDPAGTLADMVQNGIYFREIGGEVDVVLINCEGYLISTYKTLSNQRLMQQFVARSTMIGGQNKIRWVHRSLALSMSTENALKSVGENVTVSDDWSDLTSINQQLASRYIQVWTA